MSDFQPTKSITHQIIGESLYFPCLDIIKSLAIIAVIILHTVPIEILERTYSVFYIWQAVPVFFILSGITLSISYYKRGFTRLLNYYSKTDLLQKCKRLLFPFVVIFIASLMFGIYKGSFYFGWLTLIGFLPVTGPGNYYVSILLQYLLLSPLIAYFYHKLPKLSILIFIGIDLLFELIAPHTNIFSAYPYLYSACILRYLAAIALGLYISKELTADKPILVWSTNKLPLFIGIIISFVYLIASSFFQWKFTLFREMWGTQNVISFFYPLLIVILMLNIKYSRFEHSFIYHKMMMIGKSSYHIFLVQILFFGFGLSFTRFVSWDNAVIIGPLAILGNIIITLILGFLFYYIEGKIMPVLWKSNETKI